MKYFLRGGVAIPAILRINLHSFASLTRQPGTYTSHPGISNVKIDDMDKVSTHDHLSSIQIIYRLRVEDKLRRIADQACLVMPGTPSYNYHPDEEQHEVHKFEQRYKRTTTHYHPGRPAAYCLGGDADGIRVILHIMRRPGYWCELLSVSIHSAYGVDSGSGARIGWLN
jgi:hypothetical protein